MKRLWVKIFRDNRLVGDQTAHITDDEWVNDVYEESLDALHEVCNGMDIEHPLWMEFNKSEFRNREKTTFNEGNFMEKPDFDLMEIEVIENN